MNNYTHLTLTDRCTIERCLSNGYSFKEVAGLIGRQLLPYHVKSKITAHLSRAVNTLVQTFRFAVKILFAATTAAHTTANHVNLLIAVHCVPILHSISVLV